MLRRSTIYALLVGYGVPALVGQGLHHCLHESGIAGHHSLEAAFGDGPILEISEGHGHHDAGLCSICQHHSLSQLSAIAPPIQSALEACEIDRRHAPVKIDRVARFSPAQPRAPPMT